jgi:hypothetical protein
MALFAAWRTSAAIGEGSLVGTLFAGVGFGLCAGVLARGAATGIVLSPAAFKGRNLLWTYKWRWNEIEDFSLRPVKEQYRLRVRLRDGTEVGVTGLEVRSNEEDPAAQVLFGGLKARLEAEHRA